MRVRSLYDVAAAARGRRLDLGLAQADLAQRVGVSRKWIYEFEAGRPKAEFGIVLRLFEALGLELALVERDAGAAPAAPSIDLDELLDEHRRA